MPKIIPAAPASAPPIKKVVMITRSTLMPMMRAVHDVCAELGALCYASLEALMACGDGVCMGCVVEANVEIEAERMVRVCADGPVFDSRVINWSAAGKR